MPKVKGAKDLERKVERDGVILRMLTSEKVDIPEEMMAYFREHPEEVDEVTASTRVHKFVLWVGMSAGLLSVAGSKILAALPLDRHLSPGIESFVADFVVEIIFEGGVVSMNSTTKRKMR